MGTLPRYYAAHRPAGSSCRWSDGVYPQPRQHNSVELCPATRVYAMTGLHLLVCESSTSSGCGCDVDGHVGADLTCVRPRRLRLEEDRGLSSSRCQDRGSVIPIPLELHHRRG